MKVDIDAVAGLMRAVAEAEILPRFRSLDDRESWEKRSGAVVTVADERAEAALSDGLAAILPGAGIVAEEASETAPETLDALGRPGPVWIVDPIDGTANFAEGKACFAVIVALAVDGETVAGWIYDPVAGSAAVAERGAGAWRDGNRLRVAEPVPDSEMTGAFGWRLDKDKGFQLPLPGAHLQQVLRLRLSRAGGGADPLRVLSQPQAVGPRGGSAPARGSRPATAPAWTAPPTGRAARTRKACCSRRRNGSGPTSRRVFAVRSACEAPDCPAFGRSL